jgi:putative flippase GtrA
MISALYQLLRFGTVGLVNTAIGLASIYVVMFFFNTGPLFANAVGYLIGLSVSFFLNRTWTFNNGKPISKVLPRYIVVVVIAYMLNLISLLCSMTIFSINPYLAQLLGIGIYTTCMFLGSRWFVFNHY